MTSHTDGVAKHRDPGANPQHLGSVLPHPYTPKVAGYAHGPFIEPALVTPTHWRWRNARTYIVKANTGQEYRCVRVSSGKEFCGYWAVELLGIPLPLDEWE